MKLKLLTTLIAIACLSGCSDAITSSVEAWGKKHQVTLYGSNGLPIKSWITSGKIEDIEGDGCYFRDDATGLLVEIKGTTLIEVLP